MEVVKVFCICKDEYDLLEDFVEYNASIFGFKNIVLIDNNSSNSHVLELHAKYAEMGVTIHREPGPMGNRHGIILSKYMHMYKGTCEFFVPLDVDEFIVPSPHVDIISEFNNIPANITILHYSKMMSSIVEGSDDIPNPCRCINKFYIDQTFFNKAIYRSDSFISTDEGNHNGAAAYGYNGVMNELTLLHYHFTGKRRQYERAENLIRAYNYIDFNSFYKLGPKEQYDIVFDKFSSSICGNHRIIEYSEFVIAKYAIELFKETKNRLPSISEMKSLQPFRLKKRSDEIRQIIEANYNDDVTGDSVNDLLYKVSVYEGEHFVVDYVLKKLEAL